MKIHAIFALAVLIGTSGDLLIAGGEPGSKYRHDPTFAIPSGFTGDPDFHPVGYLSTFPVKNPHEQLSASERCALRQLFLKAHAASQKKYRQDYLLITAAPIYQLLTTNFPALTKIDKEAGSSVFLGDIATALGKECLTLTSINPSRIARAISSDARAMRTLRAIGAAGREVRMKIGGDSILVYGRDSAQAALLTLSSPNGGDLKILNVSEVRRRGGAWRPVEGNSGAISRSVSDIEKSRAERRLKIP